MSSVQTPKVTEESRETGLNWSRLLRWIAAAMPIALLALMVLAGGIVPFLIVPAAIFGGRRGCTGVRSAREPFFWRSC